MKEKRPIIIQGAMKPEIEYLIEKLEDKEEIELYGYIFYKGRFNEYPIIISKTDIGVINVTASTILAISKFNPVAIINQGVAGSISKDIHRRDIIIGEKCININSYQTPFLEEGKGSNSLDWELKTFKEGKDELVKLDANKRILEIIKNMNIDYDKGNIKYGIIGSGDVWNGEIDKLNWLNKEYNIICEDMETIGTYQICNRLNIPVIGVRAISDNAILGEEYERNIGIEVQKVSIQITKKIIESMDI